MTRIEKMELLNELLELEEKNDIGNLTRSDRAEFQMWIKGALEQEPKTGHWIHLKHNKGKCSECHDVVLIAQMYGNANYCPNCGARMREVEQ